jgi:methionyl-tRNA formyltransferase
MRIVFLGINSMYSMHPLLAIRQHFGVEAVFTANPDKPSFLQRTKQLVKRTINYTSAGAFSLEKTCHVYGIPFYNLESINEAAVRSRLLLMKPDVICMAGFNEKISSSIIEIPQYGILNAHPSLLPAFRGANPFLWMVKKNEIKGGVTIHRVNERYDDGAILAQEAMEVYKGSNLAMYNAMASTVAAKLFIKVLSGIENNNIKEIPNIVTDNLNCRNPAANKITISSDLSIEQACWLFNAFSDVYHFNTNGNDDQKKIAKLSRHSFPGGKEFKVADGKIYLFTK